MTAAEAVTLPGHRVVDWLVVAGVAFAASRAPLRRSWLRGFVNLAALLVAAAWLAIDGIAGGAAELLTIAAIARASHVGAMRRETFARLAGLAVVTLACGALLERVESAVPFIAGLALYEGYRALFRERGDSSLRTSVVALGALFSISRDPFVVFCAAALLPAREGGRLSRSRAFAVGASLLLFGLLPLLDGWVFRASPGAARVAVLILLATEAIAGAMIARPSALSAE